MPALPPTPRLPEIATVQDDCYLGVHARFVKQPTGVAGVLWKLQLDFDRWQVGVHVFAVFGRWDEPDKIDISRFPVRVVDIQPPEAMKSPTMGGAEAYRRPPGKVEFVLQETPVTSVIISLYGGGRELGALYCARPEDPPPPPPKPVPQAPPPSTPPWWPVIHQHINDKDAVIAGATILHEEEDVKDKKKGLERVATWIVAAGVFALAMVAGGFRFLLRFWKRMKLQMQGRKVQRKLNHIRVRNEAEEAAESLGLRVKLLFEDDFGAGLAVYMDVSSVESVAELQDLALQTYEGAGMETSRSDVITLHYKAANGRMKPLTERCSMHDVAAGGVVRLTRTTKARQKRTNAYAKLTANMEPETAAHDGDDDSDTFSDIMENKQSGGGTIALASPYPPGPVLPGVSNTDDKKKKKKKSRGADKKRSPADGENDDSDDDIAESLSCGVSRAKATSMAL